MALRYKWWSNYNNKNKNTAELSLFTFFNTYPFLTFGGLSPDSIITNLHTHFQFLPVSVFPTPNNVFSHYEKVKMYKF